jgi:capsule polysaccharide export protein KpsC/LpsZ
MSKLRKLRKTPGLFFRDMVRRRMPAPREEPPDSVPAPDDGRIPTFVIGFSPWKEFFSSWFPERRLVFLPRDMPAETFTKKYKPRALADRRTEFFVWGFKAEPYLLRFIAANGFKCSYIEDGFLRSIGLGATKTPPFSLSMDTRTPYFDARKASDLEVLLSTYDFAADPDLMARARRLMTHIVETGLSKYNHAAGTDIAALYGPKERKRVLVVGQVEDDASILYGCEHRFTNNDLVLIAATENPDAQIIFKPHPDVHNGHRKAVSDPAQIAHLCQTLTLDVPLAQAFETVDHVYTITSQAGFEALMRGIRVTTLGCPFYAGWGLTEERQPNSRRNRKLTVLEVFAASYLLYPRYFDPLYKTRLTAEEAVDRLVQLKKFAPSRPAAVADAAAPIPTYVLGAPRVAPLLLRAWFPEREFVFLADKPATEPRLNALAGKLQRQARAEWMVWDLDIDPALRKLFDASAHRRVWASEGLLRATGAGAAPAPLHSLHLDTSAHHDCATRASDLERLLADPALAANAPLLERADSLMERLFASTAGGRARAAALYGPKTARRVLVLGHAQDAATLNANGHRLNTNEDLLAIAAAENPGAQIVWRPANGASAAAQQGVVTVGDDVAAGDVFETIDHVYTLLSPQGVEAICRGIPVTTLGAPFYAGWGLTDDRQPLPRRRRTLSARELFAAAFLQYPRHFDPVYKIAIDAERAVDQLLLAGANASRAKAGALGPVRPARVPTFVFGMSPWRDYLVAWMPEREFTFLDKSMPEAEFASTWSARIRAAGNAEVFVWGFKAEAYLLAFIAAHRIGVRFVEDGFIRSIGLGGTRTPPFSLTLDSRAPYFDARQPTDLEHLLNTHDFDADPALMLRARALMDALLQSGVSKYNHQAPVDIETVYGPKTRRRVLVLGQVEEDASILFGSDRLYSNCDAVMIAALENPGAQVIYKPHPDVMNAFRRQNSDLDQVRPYCQILDRDVSLAQSFETIDHVYTITSLAGFEALMRGLPVTTLGCPFYAGWGLTDERQPNGRRGRPLSVLQVFAAAYLLYPRYFDPIYRMAIDPEQVVARLTQLKGFARLAPAPAPAPAPVPVPVPAVAARPAEEPARATDMLARVRQLQHELSQLASAIATVTP